MNDADLLNRITVNAAIFGGKPIIRGHRLAVEHGGKIRDGTNDGHTIDLVALLSRVVVQEAFRDQVHLAVLL